MKCLNCEREMVNYTVVTQDDQISYDMCEACGSLWLDAGELDKMAFQVEGSIEFSSTEPDESAPLSEHECPRCDGFKLERVRFLGKSDIVLERCANCGGFWLDGGELDLINRELEAIMPVEGQGFSDFVNNVHLPYWHKRVRRDSSETDFRVDAPPVPGAERTGSTGDACPACGAGLDAYRAHGVSFEGCPQCKGIWLGREELKRLEARSGEGSWETLRWLEDEVEAIERTHAITTDRPCPKCEGRRLLSTWFGDSGVIIDWCPSCRGVWLDQQEFREIVSHLREKLSELSANELKAVLREELRHVWEGSEEGRLADLRDAAAVAGALINVKIFEHPRLLGTLSGLNIL
ncbi:MAG: zf-TFIIB domain-containing protein [Candidatus Brocadiia bacterium]